MSKSTPGPWEWQRANSWLTAPHSIIEWTLKGPDVLCRFWYNKPPSPDAALIAAAPDMLAALKAVEEWWLREGMESFHGAPYAIFATRAAIAKAEGHTPDSKPNQAGG